MFTMLIVATIILALFAYAPDVRAEGAGQRGPLFKGTRFHSVMLKGVQKAALPIGAQPASPLDVGSGGAQPVILPDGTRNVAAR
jgi:hypothetical protein